MYLFICLSYDSPYIACYLLPIVLPISCACCTSPIVYLAGTPILLAGLHPHVDSHSEETDGDKSRRRRTKADDGGQKPHVYTVSQGSLFCSKTSPNAANLHQSTHAWHQIFGTRYLVASTWCQPLPGNWYQVLGTKYLVPNTWYQVSGTK